MLARLPRIAEYPKLTFPSCLRRWRGILPKCSARIVSLTTPHVALSPGVPSCSCSGTFAVVRAATWSRLAVANLLVLFARAPQHIAQELHVLGLSAAFSAAVPRVGTHQAELLTRAAN